VSAGGPTAASSRGEMTVENTTSTALMVDRLQINVDYKFFVRAYTSKGPGPWSNGLPFRTLGQCQYPLPVIFYQTINDIKYLVRAEADAA